MIFGKHINRYYLRYSPLLLLGLFSLAAVDWLQLIIPRLYQMLINGMNDGFVTVDGVSVAFDTDFLLDRICFPLIGIIAAIVVGRFLWRVCFFGSAHYMEADLRLRMFDRAKDLSCDYYQVNKVGTLMALFTNDLDTVRESFGWGVMMFFDASILGVMAIVRMWRMNVTLTVLSLIPTALLLASATVVGSYMMKKWDVRQEAFSRLSDFSQESFSGIAVVKAFVKEAAELLAFKSLSRDNEKANVEHARASVLLRILVTLFVESVIAIILGYGGYLVYKGVFNAGQLVEFIGYFNAIVWPVMAVSELIDMTSRGKASLSRVSKLLDAEPTVRDREGAVDIGRIRGDIEFRSLDFRYPDGELDSLSGISLKINAGESVGIVGKTGCGKTTLVDLLLRTYNVPDGTLFIDQKDVNTVTIRSVRAGCAYVPQDNFLFSDTIAENIAFGTDEYDADDVERFAVLSGLSSDVSQFPDGYGTVLGERGVTVSGGQKQRISIARALMKEAPILILDDSVSAVDTDTERTILRNLREIRKGKTTVVIAHRVSTVETMDKVVYMDDGKIADVGTHSELCLRCGGYRRMVELQRLEDERGEEDA